MSYVLALADQRIFNNADGRGGGGVGYDHHGVSKPGVLTLRNKKYLESLTKSVLLQFSCLVLSLRDKIIELV